MVNHVLTIATILAIGILLFIFRVYPILLGGIICLIGITAVYIVIWFVIKELRNDSHFN